MPNSTRTNKPAKPFPEFPLFAHATKRWAKKIRGKLHYFGRWDDPDAALQKYLDQKDDLHAGRTPRATGDGLTVRDLCNRFCTAKQQQVDSGDIRQRTFDDYHATAKLIVESFGKTRLVDDLASDDFEALRASLAKRLGPVALGNTVQRIRTTFKYAYDAGLIDKPVRHGPMFKRPSKRILRLERQKKGPRMFEPAELRAILDEADQPLKSMVLLALNAGFGNSDCASLPLSAIDLDAGWIDYPRPKTAVERRCPMWSESVASLRDWIEKRPKAKDPVNNGLVFLTKYGNAWFNDTRDSPISNEMRKLLDGLNLYRPGLSFYTLRHVFETQAGESRDQTAVNFLMGHVDNTMAGIYRERISDERLIDVTNTVHAWLFDTKPAK